MSEEKKKPKIDLKARLGKTVAASAGAAIPAPAPGGSVPPPAPGSIPPPVAPGPSSVRPSAPPGIAPPPGLSPGIPLPPFGAPQKKKKKAEPKGAEAQTIKVEVSDQILAERKRAIKRTVLAAAVTAAVGGGIGFVAGGQAEVGRRGQLTVDRAKDLETEVKTANEKMVELAGLLETAQENLKNKKYPTELSKQLAEINIPFEAAYLEGKGIGGYPAATLKMVIGYTNSVEGLNKKKETLQNLVGFAQKPVTDAWADAEKPKFKIGVAFSGGGEKIKAELIQIKKDNYWEVGEKEWPEEFAVLRREFVGGKKKEVEKKGERWKKGDLTGGEKVKTIPVDPSSVSAFTSEALVGKLSLALRDTRVALEGDPSDPTEADPGLIKKGDVLVAELHKIALAQ